MPTAATSPTPRQLEVLRTIDAASRLSGHAPTIRELADVLSVKSTNAVACLLAALRRHGLVDWKDGKGRTLAITRLGRSRISPRRAS